MQKWILMATLCALSLPSVCEARWLRRGGSSYSAPAAIPQGGSNRTAAGVAAIMARLGRVGHFGGNTGYEGCGSASTAAAAYSNCCYANSGMTTVDVGYARGANGMWYCCRRYR
jgi:hypothetical protein